jgi:hypothetical protein
MLALGLILNTLSIGLFCWLILKLAVYAVPFFVGLTLGIAALHSGSGALGAVFAGVAAAVLTLGLGQIAFAMSRSLVSRVVIAAVFVVPACMAGHQVTSGLSEIVVPSALWREVFACIGAISAGGAALARIAVLAEQRPLGPGRVIGREPQPVMTPATREG